MEHSGPWYHGMGKTSAPVGARALERRDTPPLSSSRSVPRRDRCSPRDTFWADVVVECVPWEQALGSDHSESDHKIE